MNLRYVADTAANQGNEPVYTREEAIQHFKDTANISTLPFIYLSAGVTNEAFLETLALAGEAGVPFSGVLCGRATWQDGIKVYGQSGPEGVRSWLKEEGVRRMTELGCVLQKAAIPWWDFYGGKENIQIID
ncbi:MAG: hypothetical protein K6T94_19140 [Paenibacillus sp.]|nr:hypothetical protein [Paenibacillus sp.]